MQLMHFRGDGITVSELQECKHSKPHNVMSHFNSEGFRSKINGHEFWEERLQLSSS